MAVFDFTDDFQNFADGGFPSGRTFTRVLDLSAAAGEVPFDGGTLTLAGFGDFDAADEFVAIFLDGLPYGTFLNDDTFDIIDGPPGDVGNEYQSASIGRIDLFGASLENLIADAQVEIRYEFSDGVEDLSDTYGVQEYLTATLTFASVDTIVGTTGSDSPLRGTPGPDDIYGDTIGTLTGTGGNDRIFGLGYADRIAGDGFLVAPGGRGGNDVIQGGDGGDTIWGDARDVLYGIGGNDVIYQNGGSGRLFGDAEDIAAGGRGGNDRLYGGSFVIGDGDNALIDVQGGNDLLDATSATGRVFLHGETNGELRGTSIGGDDTIKGGAFDDVASGDSYSTMSGVSRGGDDRLHGNGGGDELIGDGFRMEDTAVGGDDVLRGGAGADDLYGDARSLNDFARGGDDALHSGGGDDEIWGDGLLRDNAQGGRDRFHFNGNFGDDRVLDFRQEDGDQLVFKGLNQEEISISIVSALDPDDNPVDSTLITTLGDESVTLLGFTAGLTAGIDILFV